MVLEHLFPENWLEQKLRYAFILAFVYSTVSIIAARLLFAANSGLVAVVFTSILLIPYIQRLFLKEEVAELHETGGFRVRTFLKDNLPGLKVYASLFLGIYFAFVLYSFTLPYFGLDTGIVFREQLSLESGLRGHASNEGFLGFSADLFWKIFLNNWWVLLACFLLALLTGDGAIFFIVWNASTWGTVFAYRALAAAAGGMGDPFTNLLTILVITFPHMIFEASAYILAAIAGSIISDDVVTESGEVPHFLMYFVLLTIAFVFCAVIFQILFSSEILRGLGYILMSSILLFILSFAFDNVAHRKVFAYNVRLFIVAIIVFCLGAIIETFVLQNSSLLISIYHAAG